MSNNAVIRVDEVDHFPVVPGYRRAMKSEKWHDEKATVQTVMVDEVTKNGRSIRRFVLNNRTEAQRLQISLIDLKRRDERFKFRLKTRTEKANENEFYLYVLLFDENKFTFGLDITL